MKSKDTPETLEEILRRHGADVNPNATGLNPTWSAEERRRARLKEIARRVMAEKNTKRKRNKNVADN